MPIPRIAIVGRPNVGKSSLLNMLARERVAIVDPTPGVTRDRVSVVVELDSPDGSGPVRPVEVTDTGGFGVYVAEGGRYDDVGADLATLTRDIEFQIGEAVAGADIILFAVDAQTGITPQDEEIARLLREQRFGGPREGPSPLVRVVGTKVDGPKWEAHGYELAALGFGDPLLCSAKSKYFRRDLIDQLYDLLPEPDPEPEAHDGDLRIAIVGKRNAGKSSLVNAFAGQNRVIVSEIAGTTRDAVDVRVEKNGRAFVAIDTAGLRRKRSFQGPIEWYAFDRAKRSIDRADVVLFLVDATERISQVDEQLAQIVRDSYKPVVIVINKWDLAEGRAGPNGKRVSAEAYDTYLRRELKGLDFAPLAFASAATGTNLDGIVDLAFELHEQAGQRVPTGPLNRFVRSIVERRGPSNKLGTEARVYYVSQVRAHPPTIVMIVNRPELFTANYERFLMNRLREELPFEEVPIRLILRSRKRAELAAIKAGRPGRRGAEAHEDPDGIDIDRVLAEMPDDPEAYFDD